MDIEFLKELAVNRQELTESVRIDFTESMQDFNRQSIIKEAN